MTSRTLKPFLTMLIMTISVFSFNIEAFADSSDYPEYSGSAFVEINSNVPDFSLSDIKKAKSFEDYGELDDYGRCTTAYACVGKDVMPKSSRESISKVKPSGWNNAKYDFIEGGYLYNRCHLIAYQLTAENANPYNLITGTRYLNISGMLPFENEVADYVKETGNHVLYRVTPIYDDDELVARGVTMEGYSIEDKGSGICFNVYCYNVQPGIVINYKDGSSSFAGNAEATVESRPDEKLSREEKITCVIILIVVIIYIAWFGIREYKAEKRRREREYE